MFRQTIRLGTELYQCGAFEMWMACGMSLLTTYGKRRKKLPAAPLPINTDNVIPLVSKLVKPSRWLYGIADPDWYILECNVEGRVGRNVAAFHTPTEMAQIVEDCKTLTPENNIIVRWRESILGKYQGFIEAKFDARGRIEKYYYITLLPNGENESMLEDIWTCAGALLDREKYYSEQDGRL